MTRSGPNSVSLRYFLFAALLVYAHTADFVATSVFAHGHDSNHPVLRIEHKCVAQAARHRPESQAPAITAPPALLPLSATALFADPIADPIVVMRAHVAATLVESVDQVPLRC